MYEIKKNELGQFSAYALQDIQKGQIWLETNDSNSLVLTRKQYITLLNSEIETHSTGKKLFLTIKNYTLFDKLNDHLVFHLAGAGCTIYGDKTTANSRFICHMARATRDIKKNDELIFLNEYVWPEEWKCNANAVQYGYYTFCHPIEIPKTPFDTLQMYVDKCKHGESQGIGLFVGVDCKRGEYTWRDDDHLFLSIDKDQFNMVAESEMGVLSKVFQDFRQCIVLFSNYDHNVDKLILCLNNERYKNHSSNPEIDNSHLFTDGYTCLQVDVQANSEIRESYFTYHNCPWAQVYPSHTADWIQELKREAIESNPEMQFY